MYFFGFTDGVLSLLFMSHALTRSLLKKRYSCGDHEYFEFKEIVSAQYI